MSAARKAQLYISFIQKKKLALIVVLPHFRDFNVLVCGLFLASIVTSSGNQKNNILALLHNEKLWAM